MGNALLVRRFRFSLRTLFAAVTVSALWFGYQWNWIRERREAIARTDFPEISAILPDDDDPHTLARPKPFVLWLFRQPSYAYIYVNFEPRSRIVDAKQINDFKHIMAIFPEAQVFLHAKSGLTFRPLPNAPLPPPASQESDEDSQDDPFKT